MKDQIQTASEVKSSSSAGKLASVVRENKRRFAMFVMIVGLFFTAAFTSCNKDDDDDNGSDKVKLLEKITFSDSGDYIEYINFEYDAQDRITKFTWYYYDGDREPVKENNETYTLTYNGEDLVKFVLSYKRNDGDTYVYTTEFKKVGNQITATGTDTRSYDEGTYKLNSDGTLDNWTRDGLVISFEYYQDGNVKKKTIDDYGEWESITKYDKYDNENSPFLHCKTPKWFLLWWDFELITGIGLQNNATEIDFDGDKVIIPYVYDSDGYPTKIVDDGEVAVEFKYKTK